MAGTGSWFTAKVRRRLLITIYAVVGVVAVLLAVVLVAAILYRSKFSLSDRLSAINDVFAGAALLLALAVGAIALQSFAASTGTPEIRVQTWLGRDLKNRLIVVSDREPGGALRSVAGPGQNQLHIRLRNVSRFEAAQVTVSLRFEGLTFDRNFDDRVNEWRVVDAVDGEGATAAEWIGPAVLHAEASRRLPELDLRSMTCTAETAAGALIVAVAASGYANTVRVPVQFLESGAQAAPPAGEQTAEWL